ncbi:MAG: LPS assembly lipoprotein LptE [Gammaproteobacteria bacterium]
MRSRRRLLVGLAVTAGTVVLGGCGGWRLRGTRKNVLGDVTRVMVKAPTYGQLYAYFVAELSYINVGISQNPAQAHAIVEWSNELFERRVLSVDPDTGKVREIEVTLTLTMTVRAADGTLISAPQAYRWTEDFVFDEGSLLGTVENEQVLRLEMAKVAARALVLKLETIDFDKYRASVKPSAGQT